MKPTIYLAGKISGDPNYRTKFEAAQKFLEGKGYIVLSPAVLPSEGFSWEAYMRMSRAMLVECSTICFLPDWTESTGALLEYKLARSRNMEMRFLTQEFLHPNGITFFIYSWPVGLDSDATTCSELTEKGRGFTMSNKNEIKRLTTDDPANSEFPNFHALMNYCTAKNGRAVLCYADGKNKVDLAEYTAEKCQAHGKACGNEMCAEMTAEEVMDGALMELGCDCANAALYFCGAQAAENNARLKQYEDTGLTPEDILKLIQQNGGESNDI